MSGCADPWVDLPHAEFARGSLGVPTWLGELGFFCFVLDAGFITGKGLARKRMCVF